MIKQYKKQLILTSIVTLLPILAGLLLWNQLPDQLPIHWNINGEVDRWASKTAAVPGIPVLLAALNWVCAYVSTKDPRHKDYSPKIITLLLWLCPGLSLLLSAFIYASVLDHPLNIEILLPLVMGLLFCAIGNLLPKCHQSRTLGIRLPWTLASEENWNKTHRFAGKLWVLAGLIIMVTSFLETFWLMLGVLILTLSATILYSWRYYLKHEKGNKQK